MTTNPIIVGYDGSADAHAAADWALDEAVRTDAPVRLVYAFEWPVAVAPIGAGPGAWVDQNALAVAQAVVDTAVDVARMTHPRARITGTMLTGPPTAVLNAQSRGARLVVLGSRGRGGFTGLLLGSTGVAVSAHAHCPVVVVREPDRPGVGVGHIVAGVDGSPGSALALGFAFEHAEGAQIPLHAIHVWTPPPYHDTDTAPASERASLADLMADWQRKYPPVQVTWEVARGAPGQVLSNATRYAKLAVVGSRGRGGFRGLLLGSVSQQLLHHAQCPVAVVRELGMADGETEGNLA
jgi:nucleotide-binding universal stress UspA family protein